MALEALMWRETCSARIAVATGKVRPVILVGTLDPALTAVAAGILVQALGVLVGTNAKLGICYCYEVYKN